MTDPLPVSAEVIAPRKKSGRGIFALILIGLGLMLIASGSMMQVQMGKLDEEVANDRARLRSLEERMKDLPTASEAAPAAAAPQAETANSGQPPSITHMQSDLAALSLSLAALQQEVKTGSTSVAQTKTEAHNSLASILAFLELRDTVLMGRKYADDLAAMKNAAKGNDAIQAALEKLSPFADRGIATPGALMEELIPLESAAQVAIDKDAAKDWTDRVLAELKGLISIRPLHSGAGADFAAMETNLGSGDVNGALGALKNLPPEAQHVLETWRARAEGRAAAEDALHDIGSVLTGQGAP